MKGKTERTNDSEEQTKPTSEAEQVETASTKSDETPSEPTPITYSEEAYLKGISTAEAAVQSAKDSELAVQRRTHREEIRTLKAGQELEQLKVLEETENQRLGDTEPDLLKEVHELRRRVYATVTTTGEIQAQGYAYKLGKQYGVDAEVLLESASPEEMEAKAKELSQATRAETEKATTLKVKELEDELAKAKKPSQKIDSSAPNAAGINWRELSSEEKIKKALG